MSADQSTALQEGPEEAVLTAASKSRIDEAASCNSLDALPDTILWDIAQRSGPKARLICRTFRDLHAPPTALTLDTRPLPPTAIHHILTHPCPPSPTITSLTLPPPAPATPQPTTKSPPTSTPPPTLATIPALLPTIQALTFSTPSPPTAAHLQSLAPLSTHLTSLTIHPTAHPTYPRPTTTAPTDPPTPLAPLAALPALRTLALPCALPHPTRLAPFLAPLAALPHLTALTLHLPPTAHISGALLPAFAAAAPHLAALRLLHAPVAWDPPSIATLHHALPHLTHFHLHLGITPSPSLWYIPARPPPPGAPHPAPPTGPWQALGAALRHRTNSGLKLTTELNLASPSWSPLLPHLAPSALTLRFSPNDLHHNPPLATALWTWLPSLRALDSLTIDSPPPPPSPTPHPTPALPLPAALANAHTLTHLSLSLPWLPPPACHDLLPAIGRLTALTHLHLAGPPSAPWPPHATAPLTALTALEHLSLANGGLPRSALPHLPLLPRLHTLTLSSTPPTPPTPAATNPDPTTPDLPTPPPSLTNQDVPLLLPLCPRLTHLTLQGFDSVNAAGLATLATLTSLEHLRLVSMPAGAEWLQAGVLPLPPALRRLVVEGPVAMTLEGMGVVRGVAWRQGCRVRVDGAVVGGVAWPLDTGVVVPEEERRYKEQYRQRAAVVEQDEGVGVVLEGVVQGGVGVGGAVVKCAGQLPGVVLGGVVHQAVQVMV